MIKTALIATILFSTVFSAGSFARPGNERSEVEKEAENWSTEPYVVDFCTLEVIDCAGGGEFAKIRGVSGVSEVNMAHRATFEKTCLESQINAKNCWQTLYAMMIVESGGNPDTIGDHGKSYGPFQIQIKLHGVAMDCAKDFECSARWTLKNMIAHGYPEMRSRAIRKHNGWSFASRSYLEKVNQIAFEL